MLSYIRYKDGYIITDGKYEVEVPCVRELNSLNVDGLTSIFYTAITARWLRKNIEEYTNADDVKKNKLINKNINKVKRLLKKGLLDL